MLWTGAFNALLKTLEEPPEHVKFILATTEPQKLPATILSRCQRFDFKRISNDDIIKRLEIVCKESNIEATKGALAIIASLSEGAMRDSLSILERCIQDGENKIEQNKIKDLIGIPKVTLVNGIIQAILEYDVNKALESVENVLKEGKDIGNLIWEMIKYVKDILIYQATKQIELYNEETDPTYDLEFDRAIQELEDMPNKQRTKVFRLIRRLYPVVKEIEKSRN